MTQTTAKIRQIRSVKVWNPPQCNLRMLDLRTNKNLQRLATRTIPKDQFRIRSTKRSHSEDSEPVMAPKLYTSQILKGRAYELKYLAYGFCLNKQQANLL